MVCISSRLDSDRLESTAKDLSTLEQFLQTQWIQPDISINIISPSVLLREAIFNLLNLELQGKEPRSLQGWVLWDYGMGRDALVSAIRDWRSQHPKNYFMVMELPDDPDVILECIAAGAHAYVLQGAAGDQIVERMWQVERGVFQCPVEIRSISEAVGIAASHGPTASLVSDRPGMGCPVWDWAKPERSGDRDRVNDFGKDREASCA